MPNIPLTWLDQVPITDGQNGGQVEPHVVQLANGNILVAWRGGPTSPAPFEDIFGRIFNAAGVPVTPEFKLNAGLDQHNEQFIDIAPLPAGGFVVTFTYPPQEATGNKYPDIYLSRFNDAGIQQFASAIPTTNTGTVRYENVHVAVNSTGAVIVTYANTNPGSIQGIAYNSSTNAFAPQFQILSQSGAYYGADIAALSNGNFVVASTSASNDSIVYTVIGSNGASVLAPQTVATTAGSTTTESDDGQYLPVIAALPGNGFAIAFHSVTGPMADNDVKLFTFSAGGAQTGSGVVGAASNTNRNARFDMTVLADGTIAVAFVNNSSGNNGIDVSHFSGTAALLGTARYADGFSAAPAIASLADGRFVSVVERDGIGLEILDTRDAMGSGVYGSGANKYQAGTIGDDVFTASTDAVLVFGGPGNDTITEASKGGFYGGEGNDRLILAFPASGSIHDGGAGTDTIDLATSTSSGARIDLTAGILQGTAGGPTDQALNFENVIGSPANDIVVGTSGANVLMGARGDDSLNGGLGNDMIDGGEGVDTAIFSGAHTGYKLVYQGGAAARVSGPDGVDQLSNVEKVQFADGTYAVPTSLFDTSTQVSTSFGASAAAGGWTSQERYTRTMADVNGDGRADVIGFGEAGTYVALAKADGSYGAATLATSDFGRGASAGGWDGATALPRALADVNGDGKMDIVGFGNAGTYVALGRGDGSFGSLTFATVDFGRNPGAGGWTSQDATPRLLGDVNGDGRADVVGFGNAGTYVALARADGTFGPLTFATRDFGHDAGAGGWASQDQFPRLLADVNGDGRADVIGFGNAGTYVAFGKADGTFGPLTLATGDFGASAAAGGWSSAGLYPRAAADVNGDGAADLVGFGNAGAYVALGDGTGHFGSLTLAASAFGAGNAAGGWSGQDLYPRLLADTDGDGRADLVGFGNAGIYTATAAAFDPVVTSSGETREAATDGYDAAPPVADMPAFHSDAGSWGFAMV